MTGASGVLEDELLEEVEELEVLEVLDVLVDDVLEEPSPSQPTSNTAAITPEIISRCII
jgi:hypothetical protein